MKLINKLKTDYRLSNMIVRILFVVGFVFSCWQDLLLSTTMVASSIGLPSGAVIPTMLLTGIIMGAVFTLIIPFLINMLLNFLRVYNVPRHEYVLIALVFFDIGFFAVGILNLVNLFTPLFVVWGSILFPLVVSLGCTIGFYKVTANMYFNDVTRQRYFKNLAIIYVALVVVLGVIA